VARPFRAALAGADRAFAGSSRSAHSRSRRALDAVASGTWASAYASVRGLFTKGELARIWPAGRDVRDVAAGPLIHPPLDERQPPTAVVGQLEATNYLPFQLLRDTDCMSMAHALEVRVPLLDDDVVALAVAGQRAYGAGWSKRHLIAGVDPSLEYLASRPKRTFTLPIDDWMRGGLRPLAEGAIVGLGESGVGFDRRELTELWCGYQAGRVRWRSTWALVVLGLWLDARRDGRRQAAPQHTSGLHAVTMTTPAR
jgi:asparagine synthase (glutamine-hydrolysing)